MKKLLLLVVALVVAFGCKVKGADVVESFESFTDAKKTWLPSTQSGNAADYESTITGLTWTVCNVNAAKNTGKIYMTFKKDASSYMETIPGIVCDKIVVNVGFAGANGGITVFVGEKQISHKNVPAPGDYTFDIPVEFQKVDAKFKIVNTKKEGASNGNQISVMSITFKEATEPQPIELGDVTVTYGVDATPVVDGDTLEGVVEGTVFTFSAENAESIVVTNSENTTIAQGVATADWTATVTDGEELTVTATLGEEEKTFSFWLEVVEAPQPVLGNIIVTYGDGIQVAEDDKVSVEVGTTFTFTAENATNITVERFMESLLVVNEDANTATWTPEFAFARDGIIVTATDGTNESTFEFYLTVTEPVLPENEVWTLVTSADDLAIGGKYIIAAKDAKLAMANTNNTNNRKSTEITIQENSIVNPSETVLRLTLEKDGDTWLWRTLNYLGTNGNIANPQVYLNSEPNNNRLFANNPQEANLNRRNSSIEFDDNANAIIKFVNCKKSEVIRQIYYNGKSAASGGLSFNCFVVEDKDYKPVQIYRLVEPQPEVPAFDLMEDDATKVALMSTKGELHVWTVEYDKDGNAVKENGEDVAASVMAKAPAADDTAWTNKVAEEGENYEIYVPVTAGNYLSIRAKSVLGDLHSEELVKNVDASGNIISSVEGVAADDMNAPVEYFNLQGVRVAPDQPGLYIRRQGSKVEKVAIAR